MSATVSFVGIRPLPVLAPILSGTYGLKVYDGNCQRSKQQCRMTETGRAQPHARGACFYEHIGSRRKIFMALCREITVICST